MRASAGPGARDFIVITLPDRHNPIRNQDSTSSWFASARQAGQPPPTLRGDPLVVSRLLRERHQEHHEIFVGADRQSAAVAVRDHGIGLGPGESAMVFNRFWRADPARARTSGGTGLGLSISLEDTHLHGGWLQAWGRPGEGAQFRLTLPRTLGTQLRHSPLPLVPDDARETV